MAPSMCPDPYGTRWGSWFQAILYHVSAYFCQIFGVYVVCVFFKCHIKMTCLVDGVGGIIYCFGICCPFVCLYVCVLRCKHSLLA